MRDREPHQVVAEFEVSHPAAGFNEPLQSIDHVLGVINASKRVTNVVRFKGSKRDDRNRDSFGKNDALLAAHTIRLPIAPV